MDVVIHIFALAHKELQFVLPKNTTISYGHVFYADIELKYRLSSQP